jgi:hypothetical protein
MIESNFRMAFPRFVAPRPEFSAAAANINACASVAPPVRGIPRRPARPARATLPAGQHRNQDIVAQDEVMKQRGRAMQSRQPDDDVAEDGVNVGDGLAERMRGRQHRGDGAETVYRERMGFEPSPGDRGQRNGQQQGVKSQMRGTG